MIKSDSAENFLKKMEQHVLRNNNLKDSLNAVLHETCRYYSWPYSEVWLPDEEGKQLKCYTIWNDNKILFEEFENFSSVCKFATGVGLVGKIWEKKGTVIDAELSLSSDFLRYETARTAGISLGAGIYVEIKENFPCVFTFFLIKNDPGLSEKLNQLSAIANEVGNLLKNKLT